MHVHDVLVRSLLFGNVFQLILLVSIETLLPLSPHLFDTISTPLLPLKETLPYTTPRVSTNGFGVMMTE